MNISLSEHFDYKKLLRFTAPTMIMMLFNSIYGVVDGFFVSNYVGKDAFTAVNLTFPVIMIVASIGFMIGNGGSALISKTLGEKNLQLARKYFSMLIYFLIVTGIILAILGFFMIEPVMASLKATGEVLQGCIIYGRILLLALPLWMLCHCFQSFFIVNEKPHFGLIVAVISGVTNMVLDYLFMYLFKWGITGAALATIFGQAVGTIIPVIYFLTSKTSKLKFVKTGLEFRPILKSCINGSSEMLTTFSMSLVNILFNYQLIKYFGNDGVVAYGIIMYVGFIFTGIYLGYSFGTTPIVGYNYGAKNHEELRNVLIKSLNLLGTAAIVLTAIAMISSGLLAKIFVNYDPDLLAFTSRAIKLYAVGYLIQWINMFGSAFFTGLNNGLISATISFLRMFVFQVLMIFAIPYFFGSDYIWLATASAELLGIIVTISFLISNRNRYHYA